MFERFTDRARRVIVVAQDTARDMSHPQITPEHLLIALRQGEGVAAMAMTQSGVDTTRLRQRVADNLEHKPGAQKLDKIPFSPQAKKALELSLRQALALGHNYIGTEHLFLGVEREAEQRGQTLDGLLGVKSAEVHAASAGDARRRHRLAARALPRTSVRPGSSPPAGATDGHDHRPRAGGDSRRLGGARRLGPCRPWVSPRKPCWRPWPRFPSPIPATPPRLRRASPSPSARPRP